MRLCILCILCRLLSPASLGMEAAFEEALEVVEG
jgi:hypothetical protein